MAENLFTQDPKHKKAFLCCDGGSRGNPGIAGSGAVIFNEKKQIIAQVYHYCGNDKTNNFAEYQSLIIGLQKAITLEINYIKVFMDSKLAIEQMQGNWKVKNPHIKILHQEAKTLAEKFEFIAYQHIPREKNKIADKLANTAMDKKISGEILEK